MSGKGIIEFQNEVGRWHRRNFPTATSVEVALKLAEEVGELAHACSHLYSNIGNLSELKKKERDAIGDIVIVLAAYCEKTEIDLCDVIQDTWSVVKRRDWIANSVTGGKENER